MRVSGECKRFLHKGRIPLPGQVNLRCSVGFQVEFRGSSGFWKTMPLAKTKALPDPYSTKRKLTGRPKFPLGNRANPLPQIRVMGAEWVHEVVLGSSQSPEDQNP
jgi:hypothetical protein